MRNLIKCGRCGQKHQVGSSKFKNCQRLVLNKLSRNRADEPIQLKGSGLKQESASSINKRLKGVI